MTTAAMPSATDSGSSTQPMVDWHSHIWLAEHLGQWGTELDSHYSHAPSQHGRPDEHRAAMKRAGVTASVVIALTSRRFGLEVPNEFVAEYVASDPGRLVGIACVDPNDDDAPARLRYAVRDLGLRGVKLAPPYQDFHPHSEAAYAIYRMAADLDIVVIFHQGAVTHQRGVLDNAQPVLLDRVARDFPNLRIIIAHVGQPWSHEVIPLLRKHPNVYADLSARCTRPWQLRGILSGALDYSAQHKLLFGSDFPAFDPGEHASALLSINQGIGDGHPLPADALQAIVHNRPLSTLGLDA
jgi:uncharacterized protein